MHAPIWAGLKSSPLISTTAGVLCQQLSNCSVVRNRSGNIANLCKKIMSEVINDVAAQVRLFRITVWNLQLQVCTRHNSQFTGIGRKYIFVFRALFKYQGSMLWSQFSAIFANFRRKIGVFSKTNVMIIIFAKTSSSLSKKRKKFR
jgi:hypothetical protein